MSLLERLSAVQEKCAQVEQETLLSKLEDLKLEDNLKENILNCVRVAKASKANGIRYSRRWLYECILFKIKSRGLYEHCCRHHLLPLPSPWTIDRYLQNLKPTYGFQNGIFEMLKSKSASMSDMEKEGYVSRSLININFLCVMLQNFDFLFSGCLLIDEMSVLETYKFNKESLEILGFTDLGKYTPQKQKDKLGNHALVIMYQPFGGQWVQPIGCFLSRGAASSTVLQQILLENIVLLENSGLKVNAVVSDGAQWNRGMWSLFGVTEEKVHVDHVIGSERKLWFLSDFPHLIKNLRNWTIKSANCEFEVGYSSTTDSYIIIPTYYSNISITSSIYIFIL